NAKLQGDIISKVYKFFLEGVKSKNDDVIIVGKVGKELYENSGIKKKALYFEIPDSDVKIEDLKELVLALVNYQKIDVYYGQFESTVTQTPVVSNVSGHKTEDDPQNILYKEIHESENGKNEKQSMRKLLLNSSKEKDEKEVMKKFLFEPSIEYML